MLRRVNAALFEAPAGARIQVVAAAQDNNGVNDARFEYAGQILPRETIRGLPGCSFTVTDSREGLEAAVVFDPAAPGSARYDLFEIENGVALDLNKSTRNSDSAPLISFTIRPEPLDVTRVVAARRLEFPQPAGQRAAKRKPTKPTPRKKAARKRPTAGRKKTTSSKAAKKRTRKTSRKRAK